MTGVGREFEIPLYNHRHLFGVFLAAHAIPDAVQLLHTGVGCKPKNQRQIVAHDRMREAQNKTVWSDIAEEHLIRGSAEQLRNLAAETVQRRPKVALFLLAESTAMELTGIDLCAVADTISQEVGRPVVHVPSAGYRGDHYDGYAAVVRRLLGGMRWEMSVTRPRQVNLIGYPFDRYELDHGANLRELRRLLTGIGADLGQTILSGVPLSALQAAPESGANVLLPYAPGLDAEHADGLGGRPWCVADLPISSRGTTCFLEQVARRLALPEKRVSVLIEREQSKIAPLLRIAREQLTGRRAVVFADTPRAVGLVATLAELGVQTRLVALLDESLGGGVAFTEGLGRLGRELPADCPVLECPTAREVTDAWTGLDSARGASPIDVILAPDLWLPPALVRGLPWVEIGLPSNRKRAIFALPDVGYNGVVALAQRLLDAVNQIH